MPSPEQPLTGSCMCGAVRFTVTAPFTTAGYCHCTRCQKRSGALWALNASAPREGFRLTAGADAVRTWHPPAGMPKSFCAHCGGHVFSGTPDGDGPVGVRLGTVDGDPGIRPRWHQWVSSAPPWEALPDDGLPRYDGQRPAS